MKILGRKEIEAIAELREQGKTYHAIGAAIGCSAGAVAWQCLRLGIDPEGCRRRPLRRKPFVIRSGTYVRAFTHQEDERLMMLAVLGRSRRAIARELGRPESSVRARLFTIIRHEERVT